MLIKIVVFGRQKLLQINNWNYHDKKTDVDSEIISRESYNEIAIIKTQCKSN